MTDYGYENDDMDWDAIACGTGRCLFADEEATYVKDAHGGVWHPSEDAEAEIRASHHPEQTILDICINTPLRGAWKD